MIPWGLVLVFPVAAAPADDAATAYLREVRPVLERRCFSCHGALKQKAGLRLDTAKAIRAGGESGAAVELGEPQDSLILDKVSEADPKLRMPPEGEPLKDAEIAALRRWIAAGAPVPEAESPQKDPREHWAYRPPVRAPVPSGVTDSANPIDAFLAAARKAKGLTANPPASKDLWLRRVTLDLTGLPPTRAELHAFRNDESEHAVENVVDRLLGSPAHGERWARHWMDVWRYTDGYGLGDELRFSHYHIWRWRDWIIESLNAGTGYDQMIVAMLAGDEIAPDDPETLRATGFLVRNWDTFNRNKWLDTTIEHTSRGFLGVTMQCARCHDHKFDPVSQVDYYSLRAVFEPYQIRIDRVPGQPDRNKAGVARAFDDYIDRPTYLFRRGEETDPETTRPLTPAVPAVLGGDLRVQPANLPVAAYSPDKRDFIIAEARTSADHAVESANAAVKAALSALETTVVERSTAEDNLRQAEQALQSAKPDDQPKAREVVIAATEKAARARRAALDAPQALRRAAAAQSAAEAARDSLTAVLAVERLEDEEAKELNVTAWTAAANATVAAQRKQALAEAAVAQLAAELAVEQANAALDGLIATPTDPKDEAKKSAIAKATAGLVEARSKLAAATTRYAAARSETSQPLTTDYKPRALEFPRAKVTYRDTPSNDPYSRTSTGRRLALARWIADRGNPLTARVAVNHIWARHFGEPLVPIMFDFGLRSPQPVHHELLDWLAVEFMESGWNMKRLHKLMVTSQAYRMRSTSTDADAANRQIDPDNHYYWRMNPRRMEAEVIRDSLLHLAVRLDPTIGGPELPLPAAEEGLRRSLYYKLTRNEQMKFLSMFDAPSVEECYRRHETIVPQQALALTNSKLAFDRADEIARAITAEVGDGPKEFVDSAFERLLGRMPTSDERAAACEGLKQLAAAEPADSAGAPASVGARAAFVHVLINHNDFVTIR